jgi:hypothetical protein
MSFPSCPVRRVDRNWSSWDEGSGPQDGDVQIFEDRPYAGREGTATAYLALPGGYVCCIPVRKGEKTDGAWQWDGNHDQPTIHPSVDHFTQDRDGKNRMSLWHGWIEHGQMRGV